jgi:hypothetical protein
MVVRNSDLWRSSSDLSIIRVQVALPEVNGAREEERRRRGVVGRFNGQWLVRQPLHLSPSRSETIRQYRSRWQMCERAFTIRYVLLFNKQHSTAFRIIRTALQPLEDIAIKKKTTTHHTFIASCKRRLEWFSKPRLVWYRKYRRCPPWDSIDLYYYYAYCFDLLLLLTLSISKYNYF